MHILAKIGNLFNKPSRKMNEELKFHNAYKHLFKKSVNGISYHKIVVDETGFPVDYIFIEVNDSFEKFTGLKRDDIIGRYVTNVIPGIEKDEAEWIEKYGEVALYGKELDLEQYSESLNRWYKVSAFSPEKGYFITEFRDITDEKKLYNAEIKIKAEKKRFNDVFETIPVYLVLLTPDHHIPYANRFFRERFGDPLGRRCYEYLFGRSEPCEICDAYKALKNMAPVEWEWTGPDKRNYYIYDFPFTDADGSTLILEAGIDISELKQAQDDLQKINENLEELIEERTGELRGLTADLKKNEEQLLKKNCDLTSINGLLEDFVSIAAHDLRSPVASIKTMSQMIDSTEDPEKKIALFYNLRPLVSKMERTIDGLIEMINIKKSNQEIFKKIELKTLCYEVIDALSDEIKKYGGEIIFNFDRATSIVYVENYLRSILTNLIHNALKYSSKERKPVISIVTESDSDFFVLSVKDNGIGINLESAGKHLFKPFTRFTDREEGKGMGLYIIKNIIEKNGGFVKVQSSIGEGTTFTCSLKQY